MSGGDVLGIGVSALISAQRALNTTGHNVANVNTEGYSRQSVELRTNNPQFTGAGFVGRGVAITNITRSYDDFVTREIRDTAANVNGFEQFAKLAEQVDNLLTDPQGSLQPALQGFFNAVQDVANDPASVPARQVLLSTAGTLVDRFDFFQSRLQDQYDHVNAEMGNLVNEVNSLASALADVNRSIVDVGGNSAGRLANDLLDRRDLLLGKLSELVSVSTVDQDDGSMVVFVGNGQILVNRFETLGLTLTPSELDRSRSEIGITIGGSVASVSNQLSGGKLSSFLDYRDQILDPTRNALGRIALALANDFNTQHRLGMDLNGELGEDFFNIAGLSAPGLQAIANQSNTVTSGVNFVITDTNNLTISDYSLSYDGSDQYTMTRLSDGQTTSIDASAGYPFTTAEVDGLTVTISSAPVVRDAFLIQPTHNATGSLGLAIGGTYNVAAASPIRTDTGSTNTGSGVVDDGEVTDRTAFVNDNYSVLFADATSASADGVIGTLADNNNDSTLQYQLAVNGTTVYTQSEADAPLADLDALATAINGSADANVALTGVKAYVDNTSGTLFLANVPASAIPITVSETLNTTAGTVEDGDTVTGYFGSVLTGNTTASATLPAYTQTADSYVVVDSGGNTTTSGTYTAAADIAFNGIRVSVRGAPNVGDTFNVGSNIGGTGDNRNALALAALQWEANLESGTATYQDGYGQVAADVGTRTRQAQLNRDAQEALLNHTLAARGEVSGVNLDEEAANMIRYQQLYQASAQIIATADTLFQTLLGAFRR